MRDSARRKTSVAVVGGCGRSYSRCGCVPPYAVEEEERVGVFSRYQTINFFDLRRLKAYIYSIH